MNEGEDFFRVRVPLEAVGTKDMNRQPRILLNRDVVEFMNAHEGVSYNHVPGSSGLKPTREPFQDWAIDFRFIDKPTAMLFKLTYGGS